MDTNFSGINRSFCRNAGGAIFVGDLTEPSSIEVLAEWKQQVEEIIEGSPIPMILCANKLDLLEEMEEQGHTDWEHLQTQEGLEEFALANGFIGAVMTSAKFDKNIIPMMASLTRQMLIKELTESANVGDSVAEGGYDVERDRGESFNLQAKGKQQQQKKKDGCC
jgi:GTPase SAR1 family protein